ncbi:hypothetical protein K2173_027728 [Erythroxylum novogranatense]|uniref:Elongation of fatty acids protein 3-like n=1 Tax=Erythroxylum novogranatense TaxID=1862640 RepID=A0AAV8TZX6_9ROSI|nr:hypothetical protein K2173_027728 [Erythroxylum novogranatense]
MVLQTINYWLAEHPVIVNFRWSPFLPWGATWWFLISTIAIYVAAATSLHLLLCLLLNRRHRVPLGPVPAMHSLTLALISIVIFIGIICSTVAEIRDTRWLWRRTKTATAFEWLLCFPLGTRASGRVFFWSYIFYLSRYLHLLRTFFTILRRRRLTFFTLFNQSVLLLMSFIWLEFSQSFQVMAILLTTISYSVIYGYRFWTAIGLPGACFPFVVDCQVVVLVCNLICHFGVLLLHLFKGGCNGFGAWALNAVLNSVILFLVLKFYVEVHTRKTEVAELREREGSTRHWRTSLKTEHEKYR